MVKLNFRKSQRNHLLALLGEEGVSKVFQLQITTISKEILNLIIKVSIILLFTQT